MSDIEAAIIDHEVRCNETIGKRLVPWTWMVGIIMSLILTIGGVSWFLSSGYAETSKNCEFTNEKCISLEKRLDRLESMKEDIEWIREDMEKKNKLLNGRMSQWLKE